MNNFISDFKSPKANSRLIALIVAVISVGILGGLVYTQREVLLTYDWHIRWQFILYAFVLFSVDLVIVAWVWGRMLNSIGGHISMLQHIRFYFISYVARRLPGTIWYVAGRAYLYKQEGIPISLVTIASGLEFIVTLVAGILVSMVFAVHQLAQYHLNIIILAVILFIGILLIQPRGIHWFLRKIKVDVPQSLSYMNLLEWIIIYCFVWILGGTILYMIANAIYGIPSNLFFYVVGCWSLTGVISTSFFFFPSNMGITEISLSILLGQIMPASFAVIIAVLTRLLFTIFEIFWAIIFYQFTGSKEEYPLQSR